MIRTLIAMPLLLLFYGIMFAVYLAITLRLVFTGRVFQLDIVNSAFSEICNLFWLDLSDWVCGIGFGDRLGKFMDDLE